MSIFDLFKRLEKERDTAASAKPEWLIAGLGNPGGKYENTRHNVGFLALDTLSGIHGISVSRMKFNALVGQGSILNIPVLLIKPQTFMNLSGESIRDAMNFYKLPPERVIVIYDDVSMTLGKLRVRAKGSAGGHNGIKNIIAQCGGDVFPRIKIGVGAPPHPDYDMADWVLSNFSKPEQDQLTPALDRAVKLIPILMKDGVAAASNQCNL